MIPPQSSIIRRSGKEDHVRACVILAGSTEVAGHFAARNAAFKGDTIAWWKKLLAHSAEASNGLRTQRPRARTRIVLTYFEPVNTVADSNYNTRALVPQAILTHHDHVANVSLFPKVYIGPADASGSNMHQTLPWPWLRNGGRFHVQLMLWVGADGNIFRFATGDVDDTR